MPPLDLSEHHRACLAAREQARRAGSGVLVSSTLAEAPQDWTGVHNGRSLSWWSPWRGRLTTGIGTALDLVGTGRDRFTQIQDAWHDWSQRVAVSAGSAQPVLFGGFSFSDTAADGLLPEALMWVPRLLAVQGSPATVTSVVLPHSDVDALIAEVDSLIAEPSRPPAPQQREVVGREEVPSGDAWRSLVTKAVAVIGRGAFDKVVLARSLRVEADNDFDVHAALGYLRRYHGQSAVFGARIGSRWFVGASPEYLLQARGLDVETMALAGSIARGADEEQDEQLARRLVTDVKERHEHELVVKAISEFLSRHCEQVWSEPEPEVVKLPQIQHLCTRLSGRLAPARTHRLLGLAGDLHPTPAMGGHPRDAALEWLRDNENLRREWYAAPIGWLDLHGNGELAVAIRSAIVEGRNAVLYTGCGVVEGSVAQAEYQETDLKLETMLRALGLGGTLAGRT